MYYMYVYVKLVYPPTLPDVCILLFACFTLDSEEQFLVLPEEVAQEQDQLTVYRELLVSTQPLQCPVDRNIQVFRPSANVSKFDLPNDFFNLTAEEIKREQKLR